MYSGIQQCAECNKPQRDGAVDERDGKWYCMGCWAAFNTIKPNNKNSNQRQNNGNKKKKNDKEATSESNNGNGKPQNNNINNNNNSNNNNKNSNDARRKQGNRGTVVADPVKEASKEAVRKLHSLFSSSPSSSRQNNLSDLITDFLSPSAVGGASKGTFVSEAMMPQQPISVVTHDGENISPRASDQGPLVNPLFGQAQRKSVTLDLHHSSVDDIVSQIYVSFDEDMTKILLNVLDRLTTVAGAASPSPALTTTTKKSYAGPQQEGNLKLQLMGELLETVGDKHYDLVQCILQRPREIFLRLLEEFCTTEEEEEASRQKNAAENENGPVRFVKDSDRKNYFTVDRSGNLANEKWLAHMNRRYRELRFTDKNAAIIPTNTNVVKNADYMRITIPPPVVKKLEVEDRICVATSLPEWCRPAFLSITHLNTIQTNIFQTAFHSSQNMLVCAPTGAGKTVCALLVMLRCINEHFENGVFDRDFKIIFVAPMKALAQEMVENFSQRLAPFMIQVKELTGDMQLTKKEIAETQVIVTTPEKWDVITRKQSNEDLTNKVKLIIIDEIHLLNEDRGPVIEAIVARTLRRGEMDVEQRVRLIGLSATLPNYKDVANFLQVDLKEGLKVFGPEYRPVPLEQTFIALQQVKSKTTEGKANDAKKEKFSKRDDLEHRLDVRAYEEVLDSIKAGHQVIVFVHSRKQTIGLACFFMEEAQRRGQEHYFRYKGTMPESAQKRGKLLKGRDLSRLFSAGFGAHNAGLIRHDRSSTEALFREGCIKVLCSTSTLAWGVNLPAHTVVIRGTQMYDPKRGGLVSISVLDVMQIFGRAGRPQFDTSGQGIIISDEKEISYFLRIIANSLPIESKMQSKLCDHLNAEINAGTVSSVAEACSWLEYTYLWQRIRVNPLIYGIKINDVRRDPELKSVRYDMVNTAFVSLAVAGMIRYNPDIGSVETTDLGRLASHYYLTHETVTIFNDLMRRSDGTWVDSVDMGMAMNIAASASEFSQLRVRQEELDELQRLHNELPPTVQKYGKAGESADETSVQWKVVTLLKAYISGLNVESHSLSSDMVYITANMPRITRALLEIELERAHPLTTYTFLTLCKCIENRCWDFEHPLNQFGAWVRHTGITDSVWGYLNKVNPSMSLLQELTPKEIGSMVHNQRAGAAIADLVRKFPSLEMELDVQPITRTILRVKVTITAHFQWSRQISGNSELFWLVVEDQDNHFIFHHESVTITRKEVESGEPHIINLAVPVVPQYDIYSVRLYSDRWMGCKEDYTFSIGHLHLPEDAQMTTKLLPLQPLSVHVIPEKYRVLYERYNQFNAIQTQIFHALFHTDENIFLGAPTGSGKTIAAEMAVLRVFEKYPGMKVVYIAPLKALVKERMRDWKTRMAAIGRSVVELSGDASPDITALAKADILCTTPEKWDGISRNWQVRSYVTAVKLVVFDEVHMLGTDRGPVLEVIVSRMRYIGWNTKAPIRLIGLSTAVSNPGDLSSWLGVEKKWAIFNFDPSVRPVPMSVHIAGYPGKFYCPRMAAMNKPTYNAICEKSPTQPVIVFVSSRRQTRLTAMALIGFLIAEGNTAKWTHMDLEEAEKFSSQVEDPYVKHCLQFGVGIHHAGLLEGDRTIVESAFLSNKIQVLVATSTLAWGVNFPAHMVVVKGTEYFDTKTNAYVDFPITDVLQMVGRAGRPQFDTEGVAQVLCHEPKKGFYRRFLYDPFPVESALHEQLHVHINAEIVAGTIATRQDAVNYLTWTYLFRRIARNPSYYGLEDGSPKAITVFLSTLVKDILDELERCGCIEPPDMTEEDADPNAIQYTVLGKICSYYYVSHHTVYLFDQSITPHLMCGELLKLLCEASEFDVVPVRHNEDKLNITLSRSLPLPIREQDADNSNVKAFLLLQAHMGRLSLPITDYYTDQKSVIDNALRVIQAMVDVTANNGHLFSALRIMTLLQCLVQACWWTSASTLLQIPHITEAMLPAIQKRCGVKEAAELANAPLSVLFEFEKVLGQSEFHLEPRQITEALEGVRGLPLVQVGIAVTQRPPEEEDEEEETSYTIQVDLERLSYPQKHVVAPHFPKPKEEQFWIVIGNESTGELVAMKRVNKLRQHTTVTLIIDWDEEWVTTKGSASSGVELNLYVVCDAYLGMDQQMTFVLPPPS